MPKKIIFESAVFQFASAANRLAESLRRGDRAQAERLLVWVAGLSPEYAGPGAVRLRWDMPLPGEYLLSVKGARFYSRKSVESRDTWDDVACSNAAFFDEAVKSVVAASGLFEVQESGAMTNTPVVGDNGRDDALRKQSEEEFHDEWAASVDVAKIDVRRMNTACTAPEMRFIRQSLGSLLGKRLLDVGCGLGEASVFFAMEGAEVTATDISPGMLNAAQRLAAMNGVALRTVVSASEDLAMSMQQSFDIIYTGNTLHHVNIAETLARVLPLLKDDGTFVSWDPVAYNPVINVYRWMATEVRTDDEHPFTLADVNGIRAHFRFSQVRWFWLTTLLVFIVMAVIQRRSPNKERFWKKVVEEADRWAWLYWPLEAFDKLLLTLFPFLKPLCWNVVVIGKGPKRRT